VIGVILSIVMKYEVVEGNQEVTTEINEHRSSLNRNSVVAAAAQAAGHRRRHQQ